MTQVRHSRHRVGSKLAVTLVLGLMIFVLNPLVYAAAGRTKGSFGVSPNTGTASYTVPIWAPPGPRGVAPHLALTYDSSFQQDTYGVGWALSGLSAITRCTLTYAEDAAPAPVSMTFGDRYCLDGKRLRLTSTEELTYYGNNGPSTTTYQTELADFTNVVAAGNVGNGPESIQVQTRDGYTYDYGASVNFNAAFELTSNNVTSIQSWLLNDIRDKYNNTLLEVTYVPGTLNPDVINWSPVAAGAPTFNYSMKFTYKPTPTPLRARYVANVPVNNTALIDTISVYYGNAIHGATGATLVKEYFLDTQPSPTTSQFRLTSVLECADAAKQNCLLPTQMHYQDGAAGLSQSPANAPGAELHYDFNGDGRPDAAYVSSGTLYVALNTGNGGFGSPINTGITRGTWLFGDLLGAGADGIFADNGTGTFAYYTLNGGSFSSASTGLTVQAGYNYILADFTGDGLLDVVANPPKSTTVVAIPNSSTNGTISFGPPYTFTAVAPGTGVLRASQLIANGDASASNFRSLDFNGDGRKDVLLETVSQIGSGENLDFTYHYHELLSQGAGVAFQAVHVPLDPTSNPNLTFGNFNDDNCTDVALDATVFYSGCNGIVGSTVTLPTGGVVAAMDWDGDGRTDLLVGTTTLSWYQSTGTNFVNLAGTSFTLPSGCFTPAVIDMDADGLDDLACGTSYYLHQGEYQPPDLLVSVTDGFLANVTFGYVPTTTSTNSPYTVTAPAAYPEVNFRSPLYVVNQLTASDGIGGTYTQTFHYQNARANLQGRGFEGFQGFKVSDSRSNTPIVATTFFTLFPWTGMTQEQDVYQNNGVTPISQTVNTQITPAAVMLDSTVGNQRYFPYMALSETKSYEVGGQKNGSLITTTDTILAANGTVPDAYGNFPLTTTTVTDNDSDGVNPNAGKQWTTMVATTVAPPNIAGWCVSLPTQVEVTKSSTTSTGAAIARTTSYTPDTTRCVQTARTVEPRSNGGAYALTDDYTFDAFGNIQTDTISGTNVAQCPSTAPCMSTTDWGPSGQFPMSVTNALHQQTQFNYDFAHAVKTSETGPNNLPPVTWQPDPFGRTLQETRSDGTSTTWSYQDCATTGCISGSHGFVIAETVLGSDGSVISDGTSYLDILDRPVMATRRMLASGAYSRSEVHFDSFGRVVQQYAPCQYYGLSATCPFYTTISYDALGRPTRTQRPQNENVSTPVATTIAYEGRTTVATDANGHASTKISAVDGTLVRSQDATGYYQTFSTDAFGSVLSVADSVGNTLSGPNTYVYGAGAFETASKDIDRGAWSYTYDALGELISWTDDRRSLFSMTYDPLMRATGRTEPDLSTTWTWGNSATAHNIGRLAAVSGNGYSETYTYDNLGRLSNRQVAILGDTTYDYDYTYNASSGLLDTLTYPQSTSTYRLKLQYGYSNGMLAQIADFSTPGVVYWVAGASNPNGQITTQTLGSGSTAVLVNRYFDAVTGLPAYIQAGVGGGAALENLSYAFDPLGNLTQRQDNNAGLTEDFFPDVLNRLDHSTLSAKGTVSTNLQMHYDALGNISSRSDVAGGANWVYDPVHVHQVRTAGDANHTYSYDNTNGAAGNGNVTLRNGSSIAWSSYNYPQQINSGSESETFAYGPNRQRFKQTYVGTGGTESTLYAGDLLEKTVLSCGVTAYRHYIYAGADPVAIVSRKSTGYNAVNYILQDHLGGTAGFVDGSTGKLRVQESFGAYGLERSAADWSSNTSQSDGATIADISRRGFTFHTTLGQPGSAGAMGLIHMNGRVEDAVTGVFLSADPTIPDPGNTQAFNRYSYVMNNPLSLSDPSGFEPCDKRCRGGIRQEIASGVRENRDELRDINQFYTDFFNTFGQDDWDFGSPITFAELEVTPTSEGLGTRDLDENGKEIAGSYQSLRGDVPLDYVSLNGIFLGQYNPGQGKFESAWDNWSGSTSINSFLDANYAGFSAKLQSTWNNGLRDFRNQAIMIGGADILAAGVGAALASKAVATIDTALIRFTQSSVSQVFRTGENINDVAAALRGPGGEALARDFAPIRIFQQEGSLFTLDNRRLLTFSMAGREVPYVWATPEEVASQSWKFTATPQQAGGWYIRVR